MTAYLAFPRPRDCLIMLFLLVSTLTTAPATAAVTDLLPPGVRDLAGSQDKQSDGETTGNNGETGESQVAQEEGATGEASVNEGEAEEPPPKPSATPVQPSLEDYEEEPVESQLQAAETADIRQQIQVLRDSLDKRQAALEATNHRLAHAESQLERLNKEYQSFELRLEKAGLNLTGEYARLLRQRLDRLESQTVAAGLTRGISEQLSSAREEQLRLEEYGAITSPEATSRNRMKQKRSDLIAQLHSAVTQHIETLNEYYNTVIELQDRFYAYQELLQQRLFWLPSADPVSPDMFDRLYQSVTWFLSGFRGPDLMEALERSVSERGLRILALTLGVALLLARRRSIVRALINSGQYVGNVGRDRVRYTMAAALFSVLLALPGVLLLSILALLLKEGNAFFAALASGLTGAAFVTLLLRTLHSVARRDGLAERHFRWNADTQRAIRRNIPVLLAVLAPVIIIMATLDTPQGTSFNDSLGRLLFAIASVTLSLFAHRVMSSVRLHHPERRLLKGAHILAVSLPILLALASFWGYHYTALELEGLMFISISWLAFVMLFYYMALRGLAVRERRLTLDRLREQRATERRLAETREAAGSSGEGIPVTLDMPEMDLKDISQQSKALLKILAVVLAVAVLWVFWADVIPALAVFDNITLWTITTGVEGADPLPITLGDLMMGFLFGAGTVLAARNLPGTLEVMLLSRLKLEPGAGYAITTMATYVIVFIGIAASLAVIGLQWSKLQWLVAALGVGLGFGLQEIVANFVSGIILLFERPIRVGDTVSIGGTTGTVSRIRIRATTLVDWDRKEQIIPNKTFVTQDLTNWTLTDPITRVIIRVGVAYGSDVDTVRDLLYDAAMKNDRVVDNPAPAVFCVGFGDSSVNFEVRAFVRDLLDIMPLSHELHSAITRSLREAGIEIPFPQRDIHIRTASGPWNPGQPDGGQQKEDD
ncbi:mechanosensitive ion channel domain-containing protein [Marinobacter sp. LN3S78]|uniref:mechanosensitive ion channel domain-containing protein n=1 Tax=Marinobacter sp. LN3S78 TaxID=3382300 RepID=UPI00387AE721